MFLIHLAKNLSKRRYMSFKIESPFIYYLLLSFVLFFNSCEKDPASASGDSGDSGDTGGSEESGDTGGSEDSSNCTLPIEIDSSLGVCSETLPYDNSITIVDSENGDTRTITSNNIPNHSVGLFGGGPGSLNPNAITPQNNTYVIDLTPSKSDEFTQLLGIDGIDYSFGILLNGIEVDPVAAEPWPHSDQGFNDPDVNWEWNLEASMAGLGIDCNRAHVQPTGAYHYHGVPSSYFSSLDITSRTLVGYAADGFSIYYDPALTSSYRVKSGERDGDGITAPCGEYDGLYTADYEYVQGLGNLGECNEYYDTSTSEWFYVLTEDYPGIPRCLIGAPSNDFSIGPGN